MKYFFSLVIMILLLPVVTLAQGFEIKVKLDNYDEDILYLGYHYGEKQYLRDSTQVKDKKGYFVFSADTLLDKGMYLILMAPEKKHFQILVDDEQRISITADAEQVDKTITFKNSKQNEAFFSYMAYLSEQRKVTEGINDLMDAEKGADNKNVYTEQLQEVSAQVKAHQQSLVYANPDWLLSAIIKANWEIETPDFDGTEEEQMYSRFYYIRDHFFDHMDMSDDRLIRTPVMFPRVDAFVNKYHAIVPDSAIVAVDKVLSLLENNEAGYRYFLAHFLNHYSKSKYVGMDAVYVHLVENYYAKGLAPWVEEENLNKIIKEAAKLKPILIGKSAPDLVMQNRQGQQVVLSEIDADFTVLIFWAPDCGHCKKSMPGVSQFAEKFQDKGVAVFSVCSKLNDVTECWEMIDDKKLDHMVHVVDPYYKSRFKERYNVNSTPKIFILDKDKTIVSKSIGTEQLDEIMTRFTEDLKGWLDDIAI